MCADGIVEHVILLGAPVSIDADNLRMVRCITSGRVVNGFSPADWVLKVSFKCAFPRYLSCVVNGFSPADWVLKVSFKCAFPPCSNAHWLC